MRIKPGQHAVDRVLDQVAVVHRLHVFRAHPLEHVGEQVQQPVGLGARAILREGLGQQAEAESPFNMVGGWPDGQAGGEGSSEQQAGAKLHGGYPLAPWRRYERLPKL